MANMLFFLGFHLRFLFYFCWFSFLFFPFLNERERQRQQKITGVCEEGNCTETHILRSIQESREDATRKRVVGRESKLPFI